MQISSHVTWSWGQTQNNGMSEPSFSQNLPPWQSLSAQHVPQFLTAGQ
jgi:hypothetical protein